MSMAKRDRDKLVAALEAVRAHCAPPEVDTRCHSEARASDKGRLYLEAWVAERIEEVLERHK